MFPDKSGFAWFCKIFRTKQLRTDFYWWNFQTSEEAGLNPIQIDEVTNFPEMLDGRVKTLHPKVHGGLVSGPW